MITNKNVYITEKEFISQYVLLTFSVVKEERHNRKDEGKMPELRRQVSGEEKDRKPMLGQKLMNKFKGWKVAKVLAVTLSLNS